MDPISRTDDHEGLERLKALFIEADRGLERAVTDYLNGKLSWDDYDSRVSRWQEAHQRLQAALRDQGVDFEPMDILTERDRQRPASPEGERR
jgi:hypothetical protein